MNKKITETTLNKQIPEELWITLGGNPLQTSDAFDTSDAFIAVRIPQSQTSLITKRIDWESGKVFYPWKQGLNPSDYPYYCFNQNVLYLCVGNNPNNNEAESGNYLTNSAPTHISSVPVTYSDGYTWLSLWRLDYKKETFLTDTDLPIPDFEIERPKNTITNFYNSVCSAGPTAFGTCCLYYKKNTTDPVTGVTHAKGDLYYGGANISCYKCDDLAKTLNFEYVFKQNIGTTGISGICDSSITIKNLKQTLEENEYTTPPNSSNSTQLEILKEYYDSHYEGVMSVSINLAGLSEDDLILNSQNPLLIIADPHTSDFCEVQLLTDKLSDTKYKVRGVQLISTGSNHVYPSYTITGNTESALINYITLTVYPTDIFTDPSLLLPIDSYSVNAYVNVGQLKNTSLNDTFTKIALTSELKTRKDESVVRLAPDQTSTVNLQTTFYATVTDINSETGEETDTAAVEFIGSGPGEGHVDCGFAVSADQCYGAVNRDNSNYNFYISTLKTGDTLVEGQNYGYIQNPDTGSYVAGFKGEINDLNDQISPVNVDDHITLLGNSCRIFKIQQPQYRKDNQFLSAGTIDLDVSKLNDNVNLAFSFKINT
jgi:hypothetical protein